MINVPKVYIVILNWNGWKNTTECLESIYHISYPNYHVVVVDNNSQDDSLAKIRAYMRNEIVVESPFFSYGHRNRPPTLVEYTRAETQDMQLSVAGELKDTSTKGAPDRRLVVIKNELNFGFSEGSNIGIRYALKAAADYVLLLNNDTVVEEHFLTKLVLAAQLDQRIGATGPVVYWYDKPDTIQSTGVNVNFWTGRSIEQNWGKTAADLDCCRSNRLIPADYISGACFLVRRDVIETVGELDPLYFLYGEDADWCFRIRKAGYQIVCNLDARVWHKSKTSSSKTRSFSQYYPARNRVILMRKYARTAQFLSFLMFYPLCHVAWLIKRHRFRDIFCYLKGFIDGLLTSSDSLA